MLVHEELARRDIAVFVEKYSVPRPGWTLSSKIGHHTVRVRELQISRTFERRFEVMVTQRNSAVSALYERLGNGTVRILKPQRMERLIAYVQRMRLVEAAPIRQRI